MKSKRIRDLPFDEELDLAVAAARLVGLTITDPGYLCNAPRGRRISAAELRDENGDRIYMVTVRETQHQPGYLTVRWLQGGAIIMPGADVPPNAPKASRFKRVVLLTSNPKPCDT